MNATVTRPATRSATGKKASAGAAVPAKAAEVKPAGKLKTGAAAPPTKKGVAKTSRTTVKSTGPTAKASSRPVATKKAPEKRTASATRVKETSGSSMSGNNESPGLTDTMGKPAVSKVSEVATKTTKPTLGDGALLTEEQILQMSDKDYMNEAQLAFFKARLQQLEKDLLKNAGETTEHLRETVLVPDPADRATIEEEHALELRTRDRERKLLKKVQQAIASIDSGEYGWCEETGEPIGIPRLLARPTATLSLEAQQRRELKQKLYGD